MEHSLTYIKILADAQNLLTGGAAGAAEIEKILQMVGGALELDRVSLFQLKAGGKHLEALCQWHRGGISRRDATEIALDRLQGPGAAPGAVFAQPIEEGSRLTGALLLEAGGIHKKIDHGSGAFLRSMARMLAPHLAKAAEAKNAPKLTPPGEHLKPDSAGEIHILIVEDDEANLFMIQKFIERFGAIPHAARNGQDAVQACKERKFDVILMDLTMPKLDGFDATREIVTGANLNRSTPIIAVTADVTDGIERRCKKIGMQHYIAKPVRRETIIRALTDLTQKKPRAHS